MKCPKCKNKNFKQSPETPRPLSTYGKQLYDNFNIRYVICMQCGHKFKTQETFYAEVKSAVEAVPAECK